MSEWRTNRRTRTKFPTSLRQPMPPELAENISVASTVDEDVDIDFTKHIADVPAVGLAWRMDGKAPWYYLYKDGEQVEWITIDPYEGDDSDPDKEQSEIFIINEETGDSDLLEFIDNDEVTAQKWVENWIHLNPRGKWQHPAPTTVQFDPETREFRER